MSKKIGLASFSRKSSSYDQQENNKIKETDTSVRSSRRGRGKGEIVALTVRLPRAEWERLHQLAVSEGVSIQYLAIDGLSKIFIQKGLPGLNQ